MAREPVCSPPSTCHICTGGAQADVVIPAFRGRDYGHCRCLRCKITFDSNVNEIAAETLDKKRIAEIGDRDAYMRLFVETWEIADTETDDIYPDFNWEDNNSVRKGVSRHVLESIHRNRSSAEAPRILDVGCGNGFTTVELAKTFGKENLVGIDPSPMVAGLTKKHDIAAVQGTLDTIDLPSDSFDVVVILGNFMLHRDPNFTLAESFRLLRPGGLIIVDYKNARSLLRRLAARLARLAPGTFANHPLVQRNFVNMRYGFTRRYFRSMAEHSGFDILEEYSKPPRLLEFPNASGYQAGLKGLFWRLTDAIDRLSDNRAWVQITARKPNTEMPEAR
jgi:SAM-dependent methyltransferase